MISQLKKRANARRKTGPGAGLSAEGFSVLIFCYILDQAKSSSPRGLSGTEYFIKNENISAEERSNI
jgi:hypothetical protein